ncbi:MAG: hypothetical protein ACRD1E_07560, partial [Terriglobales bacterium]
LDQVSGSVAVSGAGDDISIADVQGPVTLDGEFVGSLSFRNLAGGLRFTSERTNLAIAALPGSMDYDMGQLAITNARDVNLRTHDEEIEIRAFSGPIEIHNRNSSVTLEAAAPLAAPITVTNRNADITILLPADSRFHLDADARNGEVRNPFPAANAPLLSLQTSNGTIALRHP